MIGHLRDRIATQRITRTLARAQSGQIIILMAFGMVALLAVLGMAIDGGRLFYLRRDAQNATDAAIVAATYALCSGSDPVFAGEEAAALNDYVDNGGTVTVTVNSPPNATLQSTDNPNTFAEVLIHAEIPSYFIHLVFRDELEANTYALGHCLPGWDPFTDGRAVIGVSETCSNAVEFSGSTVNIVGGVGSNTDIKSQGSMHIIDGPVDYVGSIDANNLQLLPAGNTANQMAEPKDVPLLYEIEDYAPGGDKAAYAAAQGLYHSYTGTVKWNQGLPAEVAAGGLIYVDGDLTIGQFDSPPANGVTFVVTGQFSMSGSVTVIRPYIDHLVIFSTQDTTGSNCATGKAVKMSASANDWHGVIYAPYGAVEFSASSNATARGAIIAETVQVSGSDNFIVYDPTMLPPTPPSIEISE